MAYTILIVDDNPVIRLSLRAFIEQNKLPGLWGGG